MSVAVGAIVHTRPIAVDETPPDANGQAGTPGDEQVTGSLERVSAPGPVGRSRCDEVRDVAFPVALRGYDREAVDAYIEHISRLVAELEASRSPEEAVRRALDQVGEETSGILQRAQETASEITARSRAQADDRLREAEREAADITAEAEERVRELDADFARVWDQRDRLLDEVRALAERLLAVADDAEDRWAAQSELGDQAGGGDTFEAAALPGDEPPHDERAEAETAGEHVPAEAALPLEGRGAAADPRPESGGGDSPDFADLYDHEADSLEAPAPDKAAAEDSAPAPAPTPGEASPGASAAPGGDVGFPSQRGAPTGRGAADEDL